MKCEICGKDSGDKALCLSCWKKTKDGEYTRCEKCGSWKKDSKPVCISCWKKATPEEQKSFKANVEAQDKKSKAKAGSVRKRSKGVVSKERDAVARTVSALAGPEEDKTLCVVCGQNSKGRALCYDCFQRSSTGEITKCIECGKWKNNKLPRCRDCWEIKEKAKGNLDFRERYADEPKYRCKSGLEVKSKAEREIANFLHENKIQFRYETKLIIGGIEVHPDFFLEDAKLILEHWGMDDAKYNKAKRKKEKLYRENKVKYVSTNKKDEYNINDVLTTLLQPYFDSMRLK